MDPSIESKPPASVNDESQYRQVKSGDVLEMDEPYTPEEERAVLRKIDTVILPFVLRVGS